MGHGDTGMLTLTLLLDRGSVLGAPGVPALALRLITDRHGPAAANRAIAAVRCRMAAIFRGSEGPAGQVVLARLAPVRGS